MKTALLEREVEVNAGESNSFTIEASAKAFKILIDGLYSDKIQSITREIWSNALDSHKMVGKENVPFDVSFPTYFSPTFKVRDYGVGLDYNEVMNLYTTLFKSTKEDDNIQVGKFGIGSKSPFAYTDTFSIISIKNGEKNWYSAVIDETGVPKIYHMNKEETTEQNGLEVSFPVSKHDVQSFQHAARRVSLGFDVKPTVDEQSYDWPFDHGMIYGPHLKMGCVLYPIDIELVSQYSKWDTFGFIKKYAKNIKVFEVPIGSVEISASRETLSYGRNEPTLGYLSLYYKNVMETQKQEILDNIKNSPTYQEACETLDKYYKIYAVKEIFGFNHNFEWNNISLKSYIELNPKQFDTTYKKFVDIPASFIIKIKDQSNLFNYTYKYKSKVLFIFDDKTKGSTQPKIKNLSTNIKHYIKDKNFTSIEYFVINDSSKFYALYSLLSEKFDNSEFITVDQIPTATFEKLNVEREKDKFKLLVKKFNGAFYVLSKGSKFYHTPTLEDEYVYILNTRNKNAYENNFLVSLSKFDTNIKIINVNVSMEKLFKDVYPSAVKIEDYIDENLKSDPDLNDIIGLVYNDVKVKLKSLFCSNFYTYDNLKSKISVNSDLHKLMDMYKSIHSTMETRDEILIHLKRTTDINYMKDFIALEVDKVFQKFETYTNKYKHLRAMRIDSYYSNYSNTEDLEIIADYINERDLTNAS